MLIQLPDPRGRVLALRIATDRVTLDLTVVGVGSRLTIGCIQPGLEQGHLGLLHGSAFVVAFLSSPSAQLTLACELLVVDRQDAGGCRQALRIVVGGSNRAVSARLHRVVERLEHRCPSTRSAGQAPPHHLSGALSGLVSVWWTLGLKPSERAIYALFLLNPSSHQLWRIHRRRIAPGVCDSSSSKLVVTISPLRRARR